MGDDDNQRELTFGEKAVGLTFNPSNNEYVDACKRGFARLIDQADAFRHDPETSPEKERLLSIAITEMQGAQMWAVKALTWQG